MNALIGSLGLDKVDADINAVPEGTYKGVVFKSDIVFVKSKNELTHVVTYKITEGTNSGARLQEWYPLRKNVVFAEGHEGDVDHVTSSESAMDDNAKKWYKNRLLTLGVQDSEINTTEPADLLNKEVKFGVKKKNGYTNVSWVDLFKQESQATASEGQTGNVKGLL